MQSTISSLVDVRRFPIHDLDGAGAPLLKECRNALEESALCYLPNFLLTETLDAIRREILAAQALAYWIESDRTLYSWRDLSNLPTAHPARVSSPHRLSSITRDKFDEAATLLSLFKCDELTEFIRRALATESLNRVECPYLSMNVKVMGESAQHGWHFDTNDGAVSLLVQSARAGGEYQYVPYIRSDTHENYEQIANIVGGDHRVVKQVDITPGTLCIFKGSRSLHRVSPVSEGDPDRLIALFAYDPKPGLVYNDRTLQTVLGTLPR
jgi:hypothetical protein